jgi:zinc finger SWIM domain-containing protein 3
LRHFERAVEDKRTKELESEFEARKKIPRRLVCTPMLVQASQAFQSKYERSMVASTRVLGDNKYAVAIGSFHSDLSFKKEHIVTGDLLNDTVSCSCGMFNRT